VSAEHLDDVGRHLHGRVGATRLATDASRLKVKSQSSLTRAAWSAVARALYRGASYAAIRRSLELCSEQSISSRTSTTSRRQATEDRTIKELGGGRREWELAIAKSAEAYQKERSSDGRGPG
jgi:hypothetical protein